MLYNIINFFSVLSVEIENILLNLPRKSCKTKSPRTLLKKQTFNIKTNKLFGTRLVN